MSYSKITFFCLDCFTEWQHEWYNETDINRNEKTDSWI